MRKEFTKKDLKDGMIVEYGYGGRRIFEDGNLYKPKKTNDLEMYNEDLTSKDNALHSLDIVKVYDSNTNMIWQRTETKYMTAEEMRQKLEELTGEKIEVEPSEEEMIGACYKYCSNSVSGECKKDCVLYGTGDCHFEDYLRDELKQCYEKVMEDGRKES